jgi:hypothetical protein
MDVPQAAAGRTRAASLSVTRDERYPFAGRPKYHSFAPAHLRM